MNKEVKQLLALVAALKHAYNVALIRNANGEVNAHDTNITVNELRHLTIDRQEKIIRMLLAEIQEDSGKKAA